MTSTPSYLIVWGGGTIVRGGVFIRVEIYSLLGVTIVGRFGMLYNLTWIEAWGWGGGRQLMGGCMKLCEIFGRGE